MIARMDEIVWLSRSAGRGDLRAAERLVEILRARSSVAPLGVLASASRISRQEAEKSLAECVPLRVRSSFRLGDFGYDWRDRILRMVVPESMGTKFELVHFRLIGPGDEPDSAFAEAVVWPCVEGWLDAVYEEVRKEFASTVGSVLTTDRAWIRSPARRGGCEVRFAEPVDVRVIRDSGQDSGVGSGFGFSLAEGIGGVVEAKWLVEFLHSVRPADESSVDPWLKRALLEPASNFTPGSRRSSAWAAFLRADRRLVGLPPDHGWRALSGRQ